MGRRGVAVALAVLVLATCGSPGARAPRRVARTTRASGPHSRPLKVPAHRPTRPPAAKGTKPKRSTEAKDLFKHSHPCPSTGKSRGACPGYVIDHIIPLCAGGADAPSNMQWQTAAAAKAKDATERRECEAFRRGGPGH
jgi:hypothetical protein